MLSPHCHRWRVFVTRDSGQPLIARWLETEELLGVLRRSSHGEKLTRSYQLGSIRFPAPTGELLWDAHYLWAVGLGTHSVIATGGCAPESPSISSSTQVPLASTTPRIERFRDAQYCTAVLVRPRVIFALTEYFSKWVGVPQESAIMASSHQHKAHLTRQSAAPAL